MTQPSLSKRLKSTLTHNKHEFAVYLWAKANKAKVILAHAFPMHSICAPPLVHDHKRSRLHHLHAQVAIDASQHQMFNDGMRVCYYITDTSSWGRPAGWRDSSTPILRGLWVCAVKMSRCAPSSSTRSRGNYLVSWRERPMMARTVRRSGEWHDRRHHFT